MRPCDWVMNEISKLLNLQLICSNHSSWSAPIIVVPKGNGGKFLVIDYRAPEQSHMEVHVASAKG